MTLKVGWESGAQTADLLRYAGPLWERETGVRIDVLELGMPSMQYRNIDAEHRAATGAIDCASIAPAWMPSLLAAGVLEPLDDYIAHYMVPADLEDYLPLYRQLGTWSGRQYGLFDDGDVLLLCYRRDLFEEPGIQRDFAARHGRPLGDPRRFTWQQFIDAAAFFTDRFAPKLYGLAPLQREQYWAWFQMLLRVNGGQFFDVGTMRAAVDAEPALRAMKQLMQMQPCMPPVGTAEVASTTTLATYLSGSAAMASFWPPLARWAEGHGQDEAAIGVVPRTQVSGRTAIALLPEGHTMLAVGFLLGVMANSRMKEAAYLFIQWLSSPEVSLQRVMLPYTLRDPYRRSHIESPQFRSLWPAAPAYLDTLGSAACDMGLLELCILGTTDYENAFYVAMTNIQLQMPIERAMRQLAADWDATTKRLGWDRQRAAYTQFLQRSGALHAP